MNPKPLLALNHFTVPCSFNCVSLFCLSYLVAIPTAPEQKRDCKCGLAVPSAIPKVLQEQQTQNHCRTPCLVCLRNSQAVCMLAERNLSNALSLQSPRGRTSTSLARYL